MRLCSFQYFVFILSLQQTICSMPAEETATLLTAINKNLYSNLNQRIKHVAQKMQTNTGKHVYALQRMMRMKSSWFCISGTRRMKYLSATACIPKKHGFISKECFSSESYSLYENSVIMFSNPYFLLWWNMKGFFGKSQS